MCEPGTVALTHTEHLHVVGVNRVTVSLCFWCEKAKAFFLLNQTCIKHEHSLGDVTHRFLTGIQKLRKGQEAEEKQAFSSLARI